MRKEKQMIGGTDIADLPELDWMNVPVRIDSGAATSAIHCSRVTLENDGSLLRFHLDASKGAPARSFLADDFKEKIIRNSSGKEEKRYIIKTRIVLFGRKIRTEFSLADRGKMQFPILLGRKLLKNRFLVDVSLKNLSAERKRLKTNKSSATNGHH